MCRFDNDEHYEDVRQDKQDRRILPHPMSPAFDTTGQKEINTMTIDEAESIVMANEIGAFKGTKAELAMALLMVDHPDNPANMEDCVPVIKGMVQGMISLSQPSSMGPAHPPLSLALHGAGPSFDKTCPCTDGCGGPTPCPLKR